MHARSPRWLLISVLLLSCARAAAPEQGVTRAVVNPQEPAAREPRVVREVPARDPDQVGVAVGARGAVTSAESNASRVGLSVLQRGGNAVDAAVAVAFALAVTHPSAGNVGGGGFMIVRMNDERVAALDYRETAPAAATADMYLGPDGELTRDRLVGPRAAGIPGTVAGMQLAHERFGSRPWHELVQPAIELAREGHELDEFHAKDLDRGVSAMREAGFDDTARLFSSADGTPLAEGELLRQPELAETLETIANDPRAFYEGALARRMAEGVQRLGGLWTEADLAGYRAIEREPLVFRYRGHEVISMPPPSSGGIVLRQILGASELLDLAELPWRSIAAHHLYIEAARRAFADRNQLLGDPDFVPVPIEKLTSMAYIEQRMQDIDPLRATPSETIEGGAARPESPETTHFSVVDEHGNAVSNTYTLNTSFGAKLAIPGTGVLLNNEMDDFASKPGTANVYGLIQSSPNAIAPGKRMLSSMTPTILTRDGELRAVVGTPGGPTIINTVAQIVRALIDYERQLDEAIAAPRLHHQWKPDRAIVEEHFEPEVAAGLRELGHEVADWNTFGHANCIEVDPETRGFRAVADVKRDGGEAVAY